MKPTPEQIKQIAIECGFAPLTVTGRMRSLLATDTELQAFFTRAYELGWKNRGESVCDAQSDKEKDCGFYRMCPTRDCTPMCEDRVIRNNTGE